MSYLFNLSTAKSFPYSNSKVIIKSVTFAQQAAIPYSLLAK